VGREEVDPRGPLGAAGVLLLSLAIGFARDPFRVEQAFVEAAGPRLSSLIAAPLARAPFSVAEWLEALALGVAAVWLLATAADLWRSRGERRRVLTRAGATAIAATAWVGVAFYALWGLAYARPAADVRMGFRAYGDDPPEIPVDELAARALDFLDRANREYLAVHGGLPDDLAPTRPPHDWASLDAAVDQGWARMAAAEGLHPSAAAPRGPSKPLVSSRLFSWLGIGGFFFPFTGEANINAEAPAWSLPSTIAHEKAHQRFVASEDEANYFGWLACVWADDPWVRYSGWMFAHRQLLFALEVRDPRTFHWVIRHRLPGVQRDVLAARAFWAGYEGPLERVSDRVNDTYLRLNAVRGGIHSYSASLSLMIAHARHRDLPR
jgi:hypothetical protein